MIIKLISLVLSLIIGLGGSTSPALSSPLSPVSGIMSFLSESVYDLSDKVENEIEAVSSDSGIVKDTLVVFFDENSSFFGRIKALMKTGGAVIGYIPDINMAVIRTYGKDLDSLESLSTDLTNLDSVALACPCTANKVAPNYTPDDPFAFADDQYEGFWKSFWYKETDPDDFWDESTPYGSNWWLESIDARRAWSYDCLFQDQIIGIVDSGFDLEHEDLAGILVPVDSREANRNRPSDHGTHVAGIIAARRDNGKGICGVTDVSKVLIADWSPDEGQYWLPDTAIFFDVFKLVKNGAKVINLSAGTMGVTNDTGSRFTRYFEGLLYSCYMGAMLNRGYDFIMVQSAGNGNDNDEPIDAIWNGMFTSIDSVSAFIPFGRVTLDDVLNRIIITAASNVPYRGSYTQTSFTNVGSMVDICAPGSSIFSCISDSSYDIMSGTSMAAPIVTGCAELVWSAVPSLTGAQVKELLVSSYKAVAEPNDFRPYEFLEYQDYPMVNVGMAVEKALTEYGGCKEVEIDIPGGLSGTIIIQGPGGNRFEFENDNSGTLDCVLPTGRYIVFSSGIMINDNLEVR